MRVGRLGAAPRPNRPGNAMILFWVGPYRMGIDAEALKEIRNDRNLEAAQSGCNAILSAHSVLGVPPGAQERLLVLRLGCVGVRVDRVERMIETSALLPLPQAFQGDERAWYCGITLAGESIIPVVNPVTLAREAYSPLPTIPIPSRRRTDQSREAEVTWA